MPTLTLELASPEEQTALKALCFAAGAAEVWFCDGAREMTFFAEAASTGEKASRICPKFPAKIEL